MGKRIINELRSMRNSILADLGSAGDQFCIKCPRPLNLVSVEGEVEAWWRHQEGDELVNRSYRNRATDELDHLDVTSNHSRSGGSRGRVRQCRLFLSDLALVLVWNCCIDRIVYHFLTGCLFEIKRAFHFATKENSRDIPKCICFLVPWLHLSWWSMTVFEI